ncbi:uncharacterized protein LOC106175420 isoform X2 [Lingula anatina]|uniref:Uncharacterized protein LOC106175420 isoform X2 n=1 Tax=Lingula anatina TaxID=7574 RepID=A0A1S3JR55_LINAN|nr:uncharacterized protein LOC106175420 isoform X2 [Lingula anatina]|eukprot:XP_013412865.1 uncharacterized protein LOC106175420 isoform X2 [Lingula anatina]
MTTTNCKVCPIVPEKEAFTDFEDPDEGQGRSTKAYSGLCGGLCCVPGCVYGAIGVLYVCVILPLGLLLALYGSGDSSLLATGILLTILPPITIPGALYICHRCRKNHHKRKSERYVPKPPEM